MPALAEVYPLHPWVQRGRMKNKFSMVSCSKNKKATVSIQERRCTESWAPAPLKPNVRTANANAVENERRPNLMASSLLSVGIGLVAVLIQCWHRRNLRKMRAGHRSLSQTIARRCRPVPARLRHGVHQLRPGAQQMRPGAQEFQIFPSPECRQNRTATDDIPPTTESARVH